MADLPRERSVFRSPFTNTGVDNRGTFYVTSSGVLRSGGNLSHLSNPRADHFEVLPSMVTEICVIGIERFASHRGVPSVFWSNNRTMSFSSKTAF